MYFQCYGFHFLAAFTLIIEIVAKCDNLENKMIIFTRHKRFETAILENFFIVMNLNLIRLKIIFKKPLVDFSADILLQRY